MFRSMGYSAMSDVSLQLERAERIQCSDLTVSPTDGFVNFTSMSALLAFCKQRLGTRWNLCNSDKLCIFSFANIQVRCRFRQYSSNSTTNTLSRFRAKLLSSITSRTLAYSIKTNLVVRNSSLRMDRTLVNLKDSQVSTLYLDR
jgi:hypothetical protein